MTLNPVPDAKARRDIARQIRHEATALATTRPTVPQANNGEADDAAASSGPWVAAHGTYTKGLEHDAHGRVRLHDLRKLIAALNQAHASPAQNNQSPFPGVYKGPNAGLAASFDVPLFTSTAGNGGYARPSKSTRSRTLESPLAGHCFDLMGADADAVGIAPAPKLGSDELIAEMAEVYGAALLRDTPFDAWDSTKLVSDVAAAIAGLDYFSTPQNGAAGRRRAGRGEIGVATLMRGSTAGAMTGPYVSQFLLVGNDARSGLGPDVPETADPLAPTATPKDGVILYGIQSIPQTFAGHLDRVDHMTEWATWRDVQNGSNRSGLDRYNTEARFIATPRDLASYVHLDALYQAYLNATLILLSFDGVGFDLGLPEGGGAPTRGAFATFGGPHILSLVTEVATRALKAVRRQKFQTHLRSRPEAVAAAIALSWEGDPGNTLGDQAAALQKMVHALKDPILGQIRDHNTGMNETFWDGQYGGVDLGPISGHHNALLPMAFPEGSPMHAAYGAGHATVAGACVTIVKAFFEMFRPDDGTTRGGINIYDILDRETGTAKVYPAALFSSEVPLTGDSAPLPHPYEANPDTQHTTLRAWAGGHVTIQGELDKLAANISIGRNFAGVHYYSDYYDSLRLGERIAVSLLQEQMLTYREPVSVRFNSFDGDRIMLIGTGGSKGGNDAPVLVWDAHGQGGDRAAFESWWTRHR